MLGLADDLEEAIHLYERAHAIQSAALGPSHKDSLLTQSNLGEALVIRGRFPKPTVAKGGKKKGKSASNSGSKGADDRKTKGRNSSKKLR